MASGAELIRKIKEQIEEVDPKDVHELSQNGNGAVIVDVRESHEFHQAHIPGAVHVPRAHRDAHRGCGRRQVPAGSSTARPTTAPRWRPTPSSPCSVTRT